MQQERTAARQRAVLAGVDTGEYDAEISMQELCELAETAGAQVVGTVLQRRPSLDSATCLGSGRLEEYSPFTFENSELGRIKGRGKQYMHWLIKELKPYIDETYRTLPDRENTMIAGSSMGGLMALYAATTFNSVFQRAACLSPSLWVAPGKILELIARAHIRRDTCIYLDYGAKEMFNHAANAEALFSTAHLLMTKRVNLTFRIVPDGTHCEASWANQVPIFMECLDA